MLARGARKLLKKAGAVSISWRAVGRLRRGLSGVGRDRYLLNQGLSEAHNMKLPSFDFVQAAAVRRAVVREGDIREDIAFQNDINGLLARLEGTNPPLTALDWIQEPVAPPPPLVAVDGAVSPQLMRVLRGGLGLHVRNDIALTPEIVVYSARGGG